MTLFFDVLNHFNKRNLNIKWCASQQLLVLQQNRLHQCVLHVMEIFGKIVACRFEQLRDLIFWRPYVLNHFNKRNLNIKWCASQQLLVLQQSLFDAIKVKWLRTSTNKVTLIEVVQSCSASHYFFQKSPSRGEHFGVSSFAVAQAVAEMRIILCSNISYSMLFKWLRTSKNKVTKLFKTASH